MAKPTTILYVDDEDINLFIFDRSFSSQYTVITANSGEQGLKKLAEHSQDIVVVISDIRMPDMDGLTFIRKARETFDNISYYILTAFNYNKEIDKAVQDKVIEKYFTKPFDVDSIRTEVDRVLLRRS
jgi:response regulator RpfG family c-di-GMP phosphodiesterase